MDSGSLIHDDPRIFRITSDFIRTTDSSANLYPEELTYTSLKGGRSHAALYHFNIKEHSYVLRLFAPQARRLMRMHQIIMAKQAGKIGIGPKVFFVDRQLEGIVMDFIPGRTVHQIDFEDPNRLAKFAHLLQRLHQSPEQFPVACSPFRRFHDFLAKGTQNSFHSQFTEVKALMEELEATVQLYPLPSVPTHLDLNPLNIMLAKEQFFLVDWVNGGMSDPYFDLATFAIFQGLNESQTQTFLKHYFGRYPTQFEWNRFVLTQPIRLFVIAAAFLSASPENAMLIRKDSELPNLADFMQETAVGKTSRPHWQISSIMFNAGLNLINGNNFQTALQDLQKYTFLEI